MKQPHLEYLARRMREVHRHQPWTLSEGGLYIPHAYWDMKPDDLSYWDDVDFILNRRRFMVSWRHPRYVYKAAVTDMAWSRLEAEQGQGPDPDWLFENATRNFKRVGKSGRRKKFCSYVSRQPSEARLEYHARLTEIQRQIGKAGIDFDVHPSWSWRRYRNAMGVNIVAPLEIRNENELAQLAKLARQLVLHQTTLDEQFPGSVYGRADWLRDMERMHP